MQKKNSHPLGIHRVLDRPVVLPQNANVLDASLPLQPGEVLIDVDCLQIDSASFHQLMESVGGDLKVLESKILEIVAQRGKMQNPVTGSGGMLIGTIQEVNHPEHPAQVHVGQTVATLISLTATPLQIEKILKIDPQTERIFIQGHAILFEKTIYTHLPDFCSEGAFLAAFDVCGAPLLTERYIKKGDTVLLMGLGKASRLVLSSLKQNYGESISVLACDVNEEVVAQYRAKTFPKTYDFFVANATHLIEFEQIIQNKTKNQGAEVVVNLVNVSGTEMAAILSTKDHGTCLFFSMATDFQKASLGAESAVKDIQLVMGAGYVKGHAEQVIELLKNDAELKNDFEERFG